MAWTQGKYWPISSSSSSFSKFRNVCPTVRCQRWRRSLSWPRRSAICDPRQQLSALVTRHSFSDSLACVLWLPRPVKVKVKLSHQVQIYYIVAIAISQLASRITGSWSLCTLRKWNWRQWKFVWTLWLLRLKVCWCFFVVAATGDLWATHTERYSGCLSGLSGINLLVL